MERATRRLVATVALLAWVSACGGQVTYDLRKVPKFRPGDRFTCSLTGRGGSAIVGRDRKLVRDERRIRSEEIVQEVLAVDEQGRVTSLRATVAAAEETTSSAHPTETAFRKTVRLGGIVVTVGLADEQYVPDTTSITGRTPGLSASQIALLKKILAQSMRFRACDPDNVVLLPTGAVAVGQTWTPARSALDRWARQNPLTRKMRAAATGARFKLAAVDGNYASVRGTVQLRAAFAGKTVEPTMQLAFSLHMPTGRWLAQSIFLTLEAQLPDAKLLVEGRQLCAIAFAPGSGRASPQPEGARKLGWPAPGKDTNNFRDAARGFSLAVPAAYRPRVPAGGDMVAGFASAAGGHLAVSLRQMPQPVEMREVLAKVLASLKGTVKQFQLQETRPLSLAGNVPAALLIGQGLGGRVAVVRLVAVDDRRVVSVAAAAPAEKPHLLAELIRIARTLRVFAPEPQPKAPASKRP